MSDSSPRLYTAQQVRRLDEVAISGHGIPGIKLMQRAGRAICDEIAGKFPAAKRWLVLCGAGNNGGDGYIAAALAQQAGLKVEVWALKAPRALGGDARLAAQQWLEVGGEVHAWSAHGQKFAASARGAECDLIIDALLGTGLDSAPRGDYADAVGWINDQSCVIVSADIPSGLNADNGCALGRAVRADLTVTFVALKRGLFTADGPDYTGLVSFSDLQIPATVIDSADIAAESGRLIGENYLAERLLPRTRNAHKGHFGHLLAVGGNTGMSGAVRLCGEAALRSGAGKVTCLTHAAHAEMVNFACPELMVRTVVESGDLAGQTRGADILVLGTGLGLTKWSRDLFQTCINSPLPMVIDADGLNLLALDEVESEAFNDRLGRRWILTPHPAEAGRLMGSDTASIQADRVGAAQALAEKFGAIIVLKGCGTVIAGPGNTYAICSLGNPGMATAGSGDVLSGVIGALIGQAGMSGRLFRTARQADEGPDLLPDSLPDLWSCALAGVAAHAAAGDRAAAAVGERGLLASDIIARLPAVLNPGRC